MNVPPSVCTAVPSTPTTGVCSRTVSGGKVTGQLIGQRLHAPGRYGRGGPYEGPDHQRHVMRRGLLVILAEHAGQERFEHLVAQRAVARRARTACCPYGTSGPASSLDGRAVPQRAAQARNLAFSSGEPGPASVRTVSRGTRRGSVSTACRPASAIRAPASKCCSCSRSRSSTPEPSQPPPARIGRVHQLEPAVEPEAVELVGANPAADLARGLQDQHAATGSGQFERGRQPGQPGTDDDDVGFGCRHGLKPRSGP